MPINDGWLDQTQVMLSNVCKHPIAGIETNIVSSTRYEVLQCQKTRLPERSRPRYPIAI